MLTDQKEQPQVLLPPDPCLAPGSRCQALFARQCLPNRIKLVVDFQGGLEVLAEGEALLEGLFHCLGLHWEGFLHVFEHCYEVVYFVTGLTASYSRLLFGNIQQILLDYIR